MFEQLIFQIPAGYYTVVTYIMAGLIGLCVGSFLNVVIYRVPIGLSLANPPSHCPNCGYRLHWYDNVPIISYCSLGGKCRNCRQPISFRYTAVEAANMLLWLACAYLFKDNAIRMGLSMVACSVCIVVCFIDIEHMIIPDRFQIILGVIGIGYVFFDTKYDWISHLIGGAAAFAMFFAVGFIISLKVKREALGGGDIKLAGVAGLILGWQRFLVMMLLASISACIVILIKHLKNKNDITDNNIIEGNQAAEDNSVVEIQEEEPRFTPDNTEEASEIIPEAAVNRADASDSENTAEPSEEAAETVEEAAEAELSDEEEPEDHSGEMPFAPYLTCGLIIALLLGEKIVDLYIELLL